MPPRENDDLSGVSLRRVESIDDLNELKRWMGERRPVLGVDTETGGLDWWSDPLRTIQLGDAVTGWCLDAGLWKGAVVELLGAYEGDLVMHNMKFDIHFLEVNGVPVKRGLVHDTRAMGHLIDPTRPTGLKPMAARYIHRGAAAGQAALKQAMSEQKWTWATIPSTFGPYWHYAALDPVLTARLYEKLVGQIETQYHSVYELEIASTMVLCDMERRGARIDTVYCNDMIAKLEPYLAQMRAWIKVEFAVNNPGSDKQVIAKLHEYGLYWDKKTEKGNEACDKEVLKSLHHPLAEAVLQYRDAQKLLSTYLANFVKLCDGDGLLHPSTNPLGARTGRMSISRPSMQNLPRSQHPRNAIISREDHTLVLADYDQIEMRLLAHFAQEQRMLEAIRYGDAMTDAGHKGYDVHSMNARGIFGLGMDDPVPRPQRDVTKNSGFAKIYGAGIAQFARTAGIPEDDARVFLDLYDHRFPGVKAFQNRVGGIAARRARESRENEAWVVSPIGRRHVARDTSKIYTLVNYLIQGTAADVFKQALVNVDRAGLSEYLILPVHDELVADVPDDIAVEYSRELARTMEDRTSFSTPLTCDVELTDRWGKKYLAIDEDLWTPPDIVEMEGMFDAA